jgi:CheY-like chemotaxis protein
VREREYGYARVLVVDDMQINLDIAAGMLRTYKIQVDCVRSGQEAIDRIRAGVPVYCAVFMDHMMPGMDGMEAAEAIRKLGTEYAQKLPIIALTANAIQGTEKVFYEHGFQAAISKPIDITEMDSVIRKWVRCELQDTAPVPDGPEPDAPAPGASDETEIYIPGVDTTKRISLYSGKTDTYLPILRSFVFNTPGILNKLKAVTPETLPDYIITVHGLKGTSAGIGAQAISDAALNLETLARAGDFPGIKARNDSLIHDTQTIVAAVKSWLEHYDAHNAKPRLKAPDRDVLERLRRGCENYDMGGIDRAMAELESSDYDEDADLAAWLREKIDISEFAEITARLAQYEEKR